MRFTENEHRLGGKQHLKGGWGGKTEISPRNKGAVLLWQGKGVPSPGESPYETGETTVSQGKG